MTIQQLEKLFLDNATVRMGGTEAELNAAQYIRSCCDGMGIENWLEDFEVQMAEIKSATLMVDGREIPCKGYFNCGSGEIEAPLCYLPGNDRYYMEAVRGKIVLVDGGVAYWKFKDLREKGALAYITYDGDVNYVDHDIDQKEQRAFVNEGNKMLAVNINVKDAMEIVHSKAKVAKIIIEQTEWMGTSRNVVAELPGEIDEWIVLSAHYDSTSLSQGMYDNWSGAVGLLGMAEFFTNHAHRRGLRFLWCGSEERGLLGSKAYTAAHDAELGNVVFNVNLDMVGCIMGTFIACCSCDDKLTSYLSYMGHECGFPISAYQDVYSSDSTPFADHGVPSLSFCRMAPRGTGTIHNSYDTMALMSMEQMTEDIAFMSVFTERLANAVCFPVERKIPEKVKEKLDNYLNRKRPPEGGMFR